MLHECVDDMSKKLYISGSYGAFKALNHAKSLVLGSICVH